MPKNYATITKRDLGKLAKLGKRSARIKSQPIATEDGRFDSKAEYERWCELKLLAVAGQITGLRRQVAYPFVVNGTKICSYFADYVYTDSASQKEIVEDCKGHLTEVYLLKKKMMRAFYGIEILETKPKSLNKKRKVW